MWIHWGNKIRCETKLSCNLTHWGQVTHICVSKLTITGSDDGLSQPNHYLNQCWNIVNWTLTNKLQWNVNRNSYIFIQENVSKNVVCKMADMLSQPQCVKGECVTICQQQPLRQSPWILSCHITQSRWECTVKLASNINCTLVGSKIVDHSDVVGASPVGAAPTSSSFSISHLAPMDWAKTTVRRDNKYLSFTIWCSLY